MRRKTGRYAHKFSQYRILSSEISMRGKTAKRGRKKDNHEENRTYIVQETAFKDRTIQNASITSYFISLYRESLQEQLCSFEI